MRKFGIIAVLALLVTALTAVPALAATTISPEFAPNGTGVRTGTIGCAVGTDGLTVSCNTFELSGVGNANAQADLSATYSADITCANPAGGEEPE